MDIADICSRLEALTEAVRGIALGLGKDIVPTAPPFAVPMAELPPAPSPEPRPRYLPTDWPRIGGRDRLARNWRSVRRHGLSRSISRGRGSRDLRWRLRRARATRLTLADAPLQSLELRLGTACRSHARNSGRDRYASEWFCNGEYVSEPDGFDKWFPSHLFVAKPPAPNSPVTIGPRALTVKLPRTMSAEAFDTDFDAEIRKAAIDRWVMT